MKTLFFILLFSVFSFALQYKADSLIVAAGSFESPSAVWYKSIPKVPKVFVWFHGGMQSNKCAKGYEAGAALIPFMNKLSSDYAVISVSACGDFHWLSKETILAVDILLDSLESRWNAKIKEVSIVGISDGGFGVLGYSLTGRRRVLSRLLVSTNISRISDAEMLTSAQEIKKGNWVFFQGGRDRLYPAKNVLPWIDSFCKSIGVKTCKIKVDERGEHDWSWWTSNRSSWIADFVFNAFASY